MKVVNVRVEIKQPKNNDYFDRAKAEKIMINDFKKKCKDAGIAAEYKERQIFESRARKDRRKRKDVVTRLQMQSLEEKIKTGKPVERNTKLYKKYMQGQKNSKKEGCHYR